MSVRYSQPESTVRGSKTRRLHGELATARKSLLHTLVEIVGWESVEKMIAEFGGARIWVPVQSAPETKVTQVLGESAASKLCAHFGGDYLQVPNTMMGDDVYRRIAELHRQGCKINDIALAVGRSRRTVFRLLRKKITDLRRPAGVMGNGKSGS
jgi:Helix-turn-helix domain of resolvase